MKDLPEDPPVWTPPAERWYARHEASEDTGMASVAKTLCAMWLMLLERLGEPLPAKQRVFTAAERDMYRAMLKTVGCEKLMEKWRETCGGIESDGRYDPPAMFVKLLGTGVKNG